MDFFARQEAARRKTGLLILYLLLAIALIAIGVNAGAFLAASLTGSYTADFISWLREPEATLYTAGTLFVIVAGSAWQLIALSGGGKSLARMVGAKPIASDTTDEHERRLINVAEEMAIASGIPTPSLYVLDGEPGINAFVAGHRPTSAVMVVTRGALEKLSRDELQGVVGHEFSHIQNGDMRINIRLMAILAGILLIGKLGGFFVRSLRSPLSSRREVRSGIPPIFLFLLGLAAYVVGYIGLFFGRLIKASISRQREFLADAASVQFTRNPAGLAGALWKIQEDAEGSRLWGAYAEDLSHLCFSQGQSYFLGTLMATHPPLEDRIKAIDPAFIAQRKAERIIARQREQTRRP